jgi:BirA family biotin operon repressor/biotin-[acetyl-CoA-carboxylase] ligase
MPANDLLDPDRIKANLTTSRIGREILVYSSTSSTNDVAAEYAKSKKNDGLVIFAEQQSAGRGRAGTKWQTGRADSILCSVVLTETKPPAEMLCLACAVATAEAVGSAARIKWPNDIILNGKKVAGILLESRKHGRTAVCILGIGINCHQSSSSFPAELRCTATSIDIESRNTSDRISLAKRLLASLDHWLDTALQDSAKVLQRWRQLSVQLGHRVKLVFNGRNFSGNCIGIDPQKGLIVQLDTGGVRMFDSAHTTIARQLP